MTLTEDAPDTSREPPTAHLLRTMGAVSPDQRVLVLGDRESAGSLARLGFDVHLCASVESSGLSDQIEVVAPPVEDLPHEDEHFAWIVARGLDVGNSQEALVARYARLRELLQSGGWLYAALPAKQLNALFEAEPHSIDGIRTLMDRAGLEIAERPVLTDDEDDEIVVRGIFRRVDEHTAA
jgi:hypothetical protein